MEEEKQQNSNKQPAEQNPQPQPQNLNPPDYLFRIKADGSWEMPGNVNPFTIPVLLRRAANQLEKRLTEAP